MSRGRVLGDRFVVAVAALAAWQAGENLDFAALIERVQHPPIARIGVVDMDAFFPPRDRFATRRRPCPTAASHTLVRVRSRPAR